MDFRQIEAFIYVCRLQSFSKAGEALFLTQPTISGHIGSLEKELGVKLLDRSCKEICPTRAGAVFYEHAVSLLNMRETAVYSLNQYTNNISGLLEIAASTIPGQYLLPRTMKGFLGQYPNIRFVLLQQDTGEVVKELLAKRVEVGIIGSLPGEEKIEARFLTEDRLVLITPNEGKFAKRNTNRLSLEEIREERFIMREEGSGTRRAFEQILQNADFNPKALHVAAQMNSTEAIKQAVSAGLGLSVASFLSVEDYLRLGLVKAFHIEGLEMKRAFYLITAKNRPLSPVVEAFISYLLDYYHKK